METELFFEDFIVEDEFELMYPRPGGSVYDELLQVVYSRMRSRGYVPVLHSDGWKPRPDTGVKGLHGYIYAVGMYNESEMMIDYVADGKTIWKRNLKMDRYGDCLKKSVYAA